MKRITFKGMAAGALLSAIFAGVVAINCGASPATVTKTINWSDSGNTNESPQDVAAHNHAKSLSNAFRGASEKVLPAVVKFNPSRRDLGGQSSREIYLKNCKPIRISRSTLTNKPLPHPSLPANFREWAWAPASLSIRLALF